MQYDVSTPEDYMKSLEADWRKEKLGELRGLILQQDPAIRCAVSAGCPRSDLDD
jgi:hypothetical protein